MRACACLPSPAVRRPPPPASPSRGPRMSPTTRRQSSSSVRSVHTCPQPDPTARPTTTEARQGEGRIQLSSPSTFSFLRMEFPFKASLVQISKFSSNKRNQNKMCSKLSMRGSAKQRCKFSSFHIFKETSKKKASSRRRPRGGLRRRVE